MHNAPPPTPLIEHVWRGLSILVPACLVIFQINWNHRNTVKAQKEQLKRQMALDIYKECSKVWWTAVTRVNEYGAVVNSLRGYMQYKTEPLFKGNPPQLHDMTDLSRTLVSCTEAMTELSFVLEKNSVALPGFDSMRTAVMEQFQRATEAIGPVTNGFIIYVPVKQLLQNGKATSTMWPVPSPEVMAKFEFEWAKWNDLHMDLLAYLGDLSVELQNHLIGPFYGNTIPRRKPEDPKHRVLSPSRPEKKSRFSWGRKK